MPTRFILSAALVLQAFVLTEVNAARKSDAITKVNAMRPLSKAVPPRSYNTRLRANNWYAITRRMTVEPIQRIGNRRSRNIPKYLTQVHLNIGTELNVIQITKDGNFAYIGIDNNMTKDNPGIKWGVVTFWVRTAELNLNTQFVDTEALEFLANKGIGKGPGIVGTDGARRGRMTYCLREVRMAALQFTPSVPGNISMASQAYPRYRAAKWTPVQYSPQVPIGTVCFFNGGRQCGEDKNGNKIYCGHSAIKIASNAWKGAGVHPTPFLANRTDGNRTAYKFRGCLKPPEDRL